jgi:hypothetical protein
VLDVLELDVLGQPDEDGERVGGVHELGDFDPGALRGGLVLLGGIDQHRKMVQERSLGIARIAGMELDVGTAYLDAGLSLRAGLGGIEAVPLVLGCGRPRIRREDGDVIQVVLAVGLRLDQPNLQAFARLDLGRCAIQARDAERDVLERPALTRAISVARRTPLA